MLCPWHRSNYDPWRPDAVHPALLCFPCVVLSCDRRIHSGLSSDFPEGREREREKENAVGHPSLLCQWVSIRGSGGGEVGRAAVTCQHTHTHTQSQKFGRPPTSELSMLLMSAQCPVHSSTFLQGPSPAPRSSRGCPSCVHRMLSFCLVLLF